MSIQDIHHGQYPLYYRGISYKMPSIADVYAYWHYLEAELFVTFNISNPSFGRIYEDIKGIYFEDERDYVFAVMSKRRVQDE